MKSMTKKLLSLALALIFVLGVLPFVTTPVKAEDNF